MCISVLYFRKFHFFQYFTPTVIKSGNHQKNIVNKKILKTFSRLMLLMRSNGMLIFKFVPTYCIIILFYMYEII